jgi:CPA2 family monovalent cation:H+ antiporter-2
VAASLLSRWLGLSAIPIFIVAGIVLGPSPPLPVLVEPSDGTDLLARIGVVLLLFFLGLEFSLDRLTAAGSSSSARVPRQCCSPG